MIRILIAEYNCSPYVHKTINSLLNQTFGDFKAYIYDDCSTDGSQYYIEDLIKNDKRFVLHLNKKHYYPCGNHWQIMQKKEIQSHDICITLDGDDWLPDNKVFERVLNYYKNDIWMSFGQFQYYNGKGKIGKGFTKKPQPFEQIRNMPWVCSHLRTFKAFLFRNIEKKNLINPKTKWFWEMAGDVGMFIPMIEMAGEKRILFTDDINYVYNTETGLNEHKVNHNLQQQCFKTIMNQKSYELLEEFNKAE